MRLIKCCVILLCFILLLSACSIEKESIDYQMKAFKVLQTSLIDTNNIFEESTINQNKAIPVLNPQYGTNITKVEETLNRSFDRTLAKNIIAHYISGQTQGEYTLLKANKHGAVDSYFNISNAKILNIADFFIEGNQQSYDFTTKNHHTFTLSWSKDKNDYEVNNYN